jgi:hypothetical protein
MLTGVSHLQKDSHSDGHTVMVTQSCCLVAWLAQVMTQQALIGTVIAIFGTWLYTDQTSKAKHGHAKPKAA